MITKNKILLLIAIAIMVAVVSITCSEKPTDAGNISTSTELTPVVAEPEQTRKLNTDMPSWDVKYSINLDEVYNPEPTPNPPPEESKKQGVKSELVGIWSGKYVTFWIDEEGNLNFNNTDIAGLSSDAGYNGKIPETFEYPFSITLVFTPPASWELDPKSEKGTFKFDSPTSGSFTGYVVQKVGNYPYGWTRVNVMDNYGIVTKQ